jgi:hypothetical protein
MIQTNNTPPAYGFDSYNQAIMLECSQTLRLNIGDDNKAKALVPIRKDKNDIPKD